MSSFAFWQKFRAFVNAPKVHFVYESLSFFAFLLLFSYYLLCKFTNENPFSITEYLVIAFVITLIIEEIKQVCSIYFNSI